MILKLTTIMLLYLFEAALCQDPQEIHIQIYSLHGSWIPYAEGPWFSATMDECTFQAAANLSDGLSYHPPPHPNERLVLKDVYSLRGECSLLTLSDKWTFNHDREKWSYKNTYSFKEATQCPVEPDPVFKGVEITYDKSRSRNVLKIQKKKKVSKYCFLDNVSAPAPSECAIFPLILYGDTRIRVWNSSNTAPPADTFYCSSLRDGCAANMPLFERPAEIGFEYANEQWEDGTGTLLGYVWPNNDLC